MSYRPEDTHILDEVDVDVDSFDTWVVKFNQVVDHLRHTVVTVSNTNSYQGNTTGNGFITGIFGANTLVAGNIRGGNVTSTNTLNVSSVLNVQNNLVVSANLTVNGSTVSVRNLSSNGNVSVTNNLLVSGNTDLQNLKVSNTFVIEAPMETRGLVVSDVISNGNLGSSLTPITIYSFPKTDFSSGKILFQAKRGANVQTQEAIFAHNGPTPLISVYGVIAAPSGSNTGILTTTSNTTHVLIQFQQTGQNTAIVASMNLIK